MMKLKGIDKGALHTFWIMSSLVFIMYINITQDWFLAILRGMISGFVFSLIFIVGYLTGSKEGETKGYNRGYNEAIDEFRRIN